MTVGELIKELEKYDKDLQVLMDQTDPWEHYQDIDDVEEQENKIKYILLKCT